MKAARSDRYGNADVARIVDMPRPEPKDDEVIVEVVAAAVTTADWRLRASAFPAFAWLPGRLAFGLFRPRRKVRGTDFAGTVIATGRDVTRFRPGDRVFGFAGHGAHAEFLAVSAEGAIALTPENLSEAEAAAVPFGALAALSFLRDFAAVRPGQRVLVNGASGGVGVFAVQLAKHFGAEVTGVSSAANLALVRSLGADQALDYRAGDVFEEGGRYDLILDTVGKTSFRQVRRALADGGVYLPIEFGLREIWQSIWTRLSGRRRVVIGISGEKREDMELLADLLSRGVIRPVVDSVLPLERVADAYRRVESRHKTGSVVVLPRTPQTAAAA